MTFSQTRQYIKGVLSSIFNKTLSNIAPKFNPTETYSIGDRVIYKGGLYRFTSAHTGAWTAADASKTNINAYLRNNSMVACGGGYAPIGTVIAYMGTRAPSDFLICDGTVYNIADYTELADFFELQFGSNNFFGGDGNTTFAVPDLRGEFLRGTGTNSHANQGNGSAVGTHQDATDHIAVGIDQETGDIWVQTSSKNHGHGDSLHETGADSYKILSDLNGRYWRQTGTFAGNGVGTFTSRPTNTSVLYCIKAKSQGNGYSLDEQIVGTWIDGKPIYQKTIDGLNWKFSWDDQYNARIKNKDLTQYISNLEKIIASFGTNSFAGCPLIIDADDKTYSNVSIKSFVSGTLKTMTLQYTKNTD